jgi:hypothetical protein
MRSIFEFSGESAEIADWLAERGASASFTVLSPAQGRNRRKGCEECGAERDRPLQRATIAFEFLVNFFIEFVRLDFWCLGHGMHFLTGIIASHFLSVAHTPIRFSRAAGQPRSAPIPRYSLVPLTLRGHRGKASL